MVLARLVSSSRAALAGRAGVSASLRSAATPKLVHVAEATELPKAGDDNDAAVSPVRIYQGSSGGTFNSFHAHDSRGAVRFFSGIRNIPRDEARKYMPRLKKANSTEAIYILEDIERDGFIPDVFHYSAAISKCAKDGKLDEANKLFCRMKMNKIAPNEFTLNSLIDACAHVGNDKEAIQFLRDMEEKYELWPDVVSYNSAIKACGKAGNWTKAIELLREMQSRGVEADVISFNSTISACEKGGETEKALDLLIEMEDRGLEADEVTFNAAISACGKGGANHTETALSLFREMCNRKIWPSVIAYSAAISACEKGGVDYTDTALQLFEEMKAHGVDPNVVSYSALISACEKGGADYTEIALSLFEELQEKSITSTEITFNSLISSCGKGGAKYVDVALRRFGDMKRLGVVPNEITYAAITKTCYDNKRYPDALEKANEAVSMGFLSPLEAESNEWDLHGLREAEACMVLASALILSVDTKTFRKILVITGKGKNSEEGPVLQVKVPAFIRDVAGLELTEHVNKNGKVNKGCFVITKKALQKWAKSYDYNCFRGLMTGKEKK